MVEYEQVEFTSPAALRSWLAQHHADARGVWAVTYRKSDPGRHVPYEEVVRQALCYGWIDARGRALDETRTQLLLTPRRAASTWSRLNRQRAAELADAGLLAPPGIAVIEAARAAGTWSALEEVEALVEPDALRAALDAAPQVRANWDSYPRTSRRVALEWIATARTGPTREQRVGRTARYAADNARVVRWPPP